MRQRIPAGANTALSQRPLADTHAPAEADGVETSPLVSDEIKQTTCYMCACRCGINVHLAGGEIRYIQGNPRHPVNRGVICGKGSAGIMQHYSPARLEEAAPARRRARRRRLPRDRVGGGAVDRRGAPRQDSRHRSQAARLLHRTRPVAIADRLVGAAIRHAELRRPWRLLLRQHGGGRPLHDRQRRSGSSASRTGTSPNISCCSASPRTTIPTRSRSASASSRRAAPRWSRSIRRARGYGAIADEWIGIRPGHRRALRARHRARAAEGRESRSGLSRPLHQRALSW